MAVLPTRYNLLSVRLERLTEALPGVETGDVKAVHQTRVASRRLRELLPVLQLDGAAAGKLTHQLRKVTRRLGRVREADVLLLVATDLLEAGGPHEAALGRARDALRAGRDRVRRKHPGKSAAQALRRIARKLAKLARTLPGEEDAQTRRAWRWALDARVSRRAAKFRTAVDQAGSVYLPERLHAARIALKKLRYALELELEARGARPTPELRALKRTQERLGRMHDLQVLIDRVREVQASLTPPSIAVWRDLDALNASLERTCRRLHARFVKEREALAAISDRLTRRAPAAAPRAGQRRRRAG